MNNKEHSKFTSGLYRLNMFFVRLEEIFLALLFFVLLVIMITQVVNRYVLLESSPWIPELSRFINVWIAYIGGSYVTFYWDHIDINVISPLINKYFKDSVYIEMVLEKISMLVSVIFILIFVNIFADFLVNAWDREKISPIMNISMVVPYISVYIGSILMIFHGISIILLPKSIIKKPKWKQ